MSIRAIAARFTDKPVKLDTEKRRVLTLRVIYEGGSLDGKTVNFPTRDLSCVVVVVRADEILTAFLELESAMRLD
jgi:hypothetical protein